MKQVDMIIEALKQLGGEATYSEIYRKYELIAGVKLTYGQKAGIRKTIETHSSASKNFRETNADLFYPPKGIGKGYWALRII